MSTLLRSPTGPCSRPRTATSRPRATGRRDWDGSGPTFAGHDGGEWSPVATQVVATWPIGSFAENLAVDENGSVFVSLHSDHRVDSYNPATGAVETICELPAPVAGLAFDPDGRLWATGGAVGEPPGYVWRITADGAHEEWVRIADALFMNGCSIFPGGRVLLVCESLTGRILAVDQREPPWWTWVADDRLRPQDTAIPGANGIKHRDGWMWIDQDRPQPHRPADEAAP